MEIGLFTDASGEQSCVSAFDLNTGVTLKNFKNGACGRNGLALINDTYLLAVQNGKQLIHIYDIEKDTCVKKIVCAERITALTTTPDGLFVVAALQDKIHIWEFSSGNLYCVLSRHYQDVVGIKFTNDGKFFVSYGCDNLVIVWDFNSVLQSCMTSQSSLDAHDKPVNIISNHSMPVQDVYLGVCGIRGNMVTCSLDQTCKVFDIFSGQLLKNFIFDTPCTSVTMDVCEKFLFVGLSDGRISFINCFEKRPIISDIAVELSCYLTAHKKAVTSLVVTSDGRQLISGSKDCLVKIWHIASRKCVRSFEYKDEVTNVQLKPSYIFTSLTNNYSAIHQNNRKNKRCKKSVGNFQRTVYVPTSSGNIEELFAQDQLDTIPFVLKDIKKDDRMVQRSDYMHNVLREFYYSNIETSNLTASRQELVNNVAALEAMTQDLYKASSEKLLQRLRQAETNG